MVENVNLMKMNGKFFFLLVHFLDLFEPKWLYEYKKNKIKYIYPDRLNIIVLKSL